MNEFRQMQYSEKQFPKVSVIVPVYGVGNYIEHCAVSLMEQTLEGLEYIFVDDCSPDDSRTIIQEVISRYPDRNAQLVSHSENRGLPSARNTGLGLATGKYVFHCDGDDWVEPDMLEKMYDLAERERADIVYSDFYLSYEKNERYMSNLCLESAEALLRHGFLSGAVKYNVWNKLVKRSLYTDNGIFFPDGHSMGEDMTMIRLTSCADKVKYLPEALYHYVQTNSAAFSKTQSSKQLTDIQHNVDATVSFLRERYGDRLEDDIRNFKLSIKFPFLISDKSGQYKLWKEWYPEANANVLSNRMLPFRSRILQWMASRNLWFGVRLYYSFVYKVLYRLLYK
ncbi:MAG: glycosyltransferase family 2 protein [Candidatus Cryptobacteroides sp.]